MMNHPLTQLKVWKLVEKVTQTTDWNNCDDYEDVLYARAAADWQLEQVIEWLEKKRGGSMRLHSSEINSLIVDLKKAMRPQEDN